MSILINGGGIVGLFLAKILAKLTNNQLEIFIIERCSLDGNYFAFSKNIPNVIVLSRGAYSEFLKIDMNFVFLQYGTAIKQIEISEYTRFSKIFIQAEDYQLSELGYVIKLNEIRKALLNSISKQPMIHLYCPATIQKIYRETSKNVIILNNGKKIISKLVVAADGSQSELATHCGIQWIQHDYQQTAVITEITTEIPHLNKAFERFTKYGPLAVLPMFHNNVSVVIWCISSQIKKEVSKWDTDKFIQELQKIFGWRLGKILKVKNRFFYDLLLTYANRHIVHRIALVGNSAQTIHPVAGQGLNLGIRDAIILAKTIQRALYSNLDFGEYSVLNLYQKNRKIDQEFIINITDGLVKIFSNQYMPLVIIRNLSLFCISYSAFLKYLLIDIALSWEIDQ